jgi:hypothetical protein
MVPNPRRFTSTSDPIRTVPDFAAVTAELMG